MKHLRALWADDDWDDTAGRSSERRLLESTSKRLDTHLQTRGISVRWERTSRAADASVTVAQDGSELRLAVVDLRFSGQHWEGRAILRSLVDRRVPFLLFSDWLDSAGEFASSGLCLGKFSKTEEGMTALIQRVTQFLLAPPLRLLHLSDLHVNSSLTEAETAEQAALFDALTLRLQGLSRERPFDAVFFSGDIGHVSPDYDIERGRDIVLDLVHAAGVGSQLDRVFIVPGNHDVSWSDFPNRILGTRPWAPFLRFWSRLYRGNPRMSSSLGAWDPATRSFVETASSEQIRWHTRAAEINLSVIGVSSTVLDPARQGSGEFSSAHTAFVDASWAEAPPFGEVRVFLVHHNLLGVLSKSRYDDSSTLSYPGEALWSLMRARCNIVFCGHTHTSNVYRLHAARLGTGGGFQDVGPLCVVAGGATGGVHGARDRPRCFGVLDISDGGAGVRHLSLQNYEYDSGDHSWRAVAEGLTAGWLTT